MPSTSQIKPSQLDCRRSGNIDEITIEGNSPELNGNSGLDDAKVTDLVVTHDVGQAVTVIEPSPVSNKKFDTAYSWLQCILGLLVVLSTLGLSSSFAIFQLYYQKRLGLGHSTVSWIGSTQVFFFFFLSAASGHLSDAGYTRHLMLSGSTLVVLGLIGQSFAVQFWQVLLSQGFCVGIGGGLIINPAVSRSTEHFRRYKALAIVITSIGASLGGVCFPAISALLFPRIGFGWTIRVFALVDLVILAIASLLLKSNSSRRPEFRGQLSTVLTVPFIFYTTGVFFVFLGIFCGLFYIGTYGTEIIGLRRSESLDMVAVVNSAGIVGRLFVGLASLRIDSVNLGIASILSSTVLMYVWKLVHNRSGMITWSILYGATTAAAQGLAAAGICSICRDLHGPGTAIGVVFTAISVGSLIGTPISGAWIWLANGSYLYAQMFSGTVMTIGLGLVVMAKFTNWRRKQ